MNERIQELAEQAFFETEYDDAQNLPETMQRFAELIVRECASLCSTTASGRDAEVIEEAILKYFGIKE